MSMVPLVLRPLNRMWKECGEMRIQCWFRAARPMRLQNGATSSRKRLQCSTVHFSSRRWLHVNVVVRQLDYHPASDH